MTFRFKSFFFDKQFITIILCIVWILLVLIDYLNKHSVYIDSIIHFKYFNLAIFIISYIVLAAYLFHNKYFLAGRVKSIFKFNVLISIPIFILATNISFSAFHSEKIGFQEHLYLLYNSLYVSLSGGVILISSYCIGRQISERYLNKKVIYNSQFTLDLVLGIICSTMMLFLVAVIHYLNFWTGLIIVLLPLVIFSKTMIQAFKTLYSFQPSYSWIDVVLLQVMIFFGVINFMFALGPFPLGFDSRNLYVNVANLVAENGSILRGVQPYNWELYSAAGKVVFGKLEVIMFLFQVGGWLAAIAVYQLSKNLLKLSSTVSLWVALILLVTPAVFRQMFIELKIDLALLFVQIVTLHFVVSHFIYKNKKNNASILFSIVLGVLLGFGLGIKVLNFFLIYGILVAVAIDRSSLYAGMGTAMLGLAIILFLQLDVYSGLRVYHPYVNELTLILTLIGGGILGFQSRANFTSIKRVAKDYALVFFCMLLLISPWMINNYEYGKSQSLLQIIRGKGTGHSLDVNKVIEIYNQQSEPTDE